MSRYKKIMIPLLALSIFCKVGFAKRDNFASFQEETKDSLIVKYLSDTLNATSKIIALIQNADGTYYTPVNKEEAIKRLQIAITLEPFSKDSPEILSKLNARFGSELFGAGAFNLSMQYMRASLTYQRKAIPGPSDRAYNLLGKIGSFFMEHGQYDSAQYYYALTIAEAEGTKNPLWIASARNNQGILFLRTGKLNAAQENFDKAKEMLKLRQRSDTVLMRSINDNLAQLAVKKRDYATAIRQYQYNLAHYDYLNRIDDLFKAQAGLADVYLLQHNIPAVQKQVKILRDYIENHKPPINIKYTMQYHEILKQLYELQANWKEVAIEQHNISALQDSINKENNQQLNELLQALTYSQIFKFRTELKLHQVQLAQKEKNLKTTRLVAIVVTLLSIWVLVLLFLYYRNRNLIQKDKIAMHIKDRQLAEATLRYQKLEQEKLEKELHYKKKDISDLALYLSKLKDVNDSMMDRLEELKAIKPEEQKSAIHSMTNELGALLHSHEKINMIQENIELVNKEFSAKLMNEFPDLTKSEIELCGFFRMNMSNKEIGLLKNISPQSVKMARYRMRKKFSLGSEVDIYKFLANY